ncbi:uncharacterized protein [Paramormyrops kingsleyae]|uniref:uncharacterized protein n=1 Tax=Paramormyrops kingsleyae TaxID=1676925 RepID=UPI003B9770C6
MDNTVNGANSNILTMTVLMAYGAFWLFESLFLGPSYFLHALIYNIWNHCYSVQVHMLVAGETFQTHYTFMQKLKLKIELCSAESCNVILVFCPVVSRIGTDMEAAMNRVPDNKPVILVFMHHCRNSSHMTNITVQPSSSNIVKIVHCAFHEYDGLLLCQENEQAVTEVHSMLLSFQLPDSDCLAAMPKIPISAASLPAQFLLHPTSWRSPMSPAKIHMGLYLKSK